MEDIPQQLKDATIAVEDKDFINTRDCPGPEYSGASQHFRVP